MAWCSSTLERWYRSKGHCSKLKASNTSGIIRESTGDQIVACMKGSKGAQDACRPSAFMIFMASLIRLGLVRLLQQLNGRMKVEGTFG